VSNITIGWKRLCVYAFLASLAGSPALRAQSASGIISGTILDPTGQAIQKASVVAKEEANGTEHKAKTGSDGRFAITALPAGVYTIEAAASGFATTRHGAVELAEAGMQDISISLNVANVNSQVTVNDVVSLAADISPVQASLDVASAESVIPLDYIRHFTSPVADYTETVAMAPGTFSVNPNGTGLGQASLYFRGFPDGDFTIAFDGIPFEDTNTPTHHSWVFFPSPWVGGTVFDRSPGTAATVGPTNFGGSINLLSPPTQPDPSVRLTYAYGSWATQLMDLNMDSGNFGPGGKSSLTVDVQQMRSNGFETDNYQRRDAGSLKYVFRLSDKTMMTVWGGVVDIWTNTPNIGPTRGQITQYGYNYLNNGNPSSQGFFAYNYYHVQSDFAYYGIKTDLGSGWKLDNKVYFYRYWNKQNYDNAATFSATSSVNKLNGYSKGGDITTLSWESRYGVLRTGAWYEWAYTDRYQIPQNTLTQVDAPAPNFHEHFVTQSIQPFLEYEYRITPKLTFTPGIKSAAYAMHLNQYQDNGGKIGCLGGTPVTTAAGKGCIGGADFVTHNAVYNSWLPFGSLHYSIKNNWAAYFQYGAGSIIPPSSVFDVKNANVETTPKPEIVHTYQTGSVWKINRLMLDGDFYYSKFQNAYTSYLDPVTQIPIYTLPPGGDSITKGVELERKPRARLRSRALLQRHGGKCKVRSQQALGRQHAEKHRGDRPDLPEAGVGCRHLRKTHRPDV
jgi:iron complex outermembrane recepter protein